MLYTRPFHGESGIWTSVSRMVRFSRSRHNELPRVGSRETSGLTARFCRLTRPSLLPRSRFLRHCSDPPRSALDLATGNRSTMILGTYPSVKRDRLQVCSGVSFRARRFLSEALPPPYARTTPERQRAWDRSGGRASGFYLALDANRGISHHVVIMTLRDRHHTQ
jgi:hypothetical protein